MIVLLNIMKVWTIIINCCISCIRVYGGANNLGAILHSTKMHRYPLKENSFNIIDGGKVSISFACGSCDNNFRTNTWKVGLLNTPPTNKLRKAMNKKQLAAHEKHNKFLKKMGLTEKTVCKNKPSTMPTFLKDDLAKSYQSELSNTIDGAQTAGSCKGIMTDIFNYTEADREIARTMAKQVSIEYNKGGLQYISAGTDLTKMGKKV